MPHGINLADIKVTVKYFCELYINGLANRRTNLGAHDHA